MTSYLAIDTDCHVGEPADLWTSRIPGHADSVPRVQLNEQKNRHEWWIGDRYVTLAPAGTVAGADVVPPTNPRTYDEAHPAAFDIDERLKVMDEERIWAQVLYPNVGGFGNDHFMKIEDVGLRNECVRAYNDYLADWIGTHTDRFVGVCMLPFWDLDETVREIERSSKLGHKAILMTGKPDVWWGSPHIADPFWNPVWDVTRDLGMSVSFHAGGGDPALGWRAAGYKGMPARTRFTANSVPTFFGNAQTLVDVIFGGIPVRYPELKFVIVESGIGWVPFLLECMDYQFLEHRVREVSPELELMPSDYFRQSILTTFWFEKAAPELLIDRIGEDNVMFETDFPHPTSLWPPQSVREHAEHCLAKQPKRVQEKVLWRTAAEMYGLNMPIGEAV
jgi:predicted TIM-barrel fold metal-dependent hydrolase